MIIKGYKFRTLKYGLRAVWEKDQGDLSEGSSGSQERLPVKSDVK